MKMIDRKGDMTKSDKMLLALALVLTILFGWAVTRGNKPFAQDKACYICGHNECDAPNDHELPDWMINANLDRKE